MYVCRASNRGRIRFVRSGPAPPDPEPRSLRSSSEKWAAKTNEKSWLRSDIKSPATVSSLKSGDLPRFFMIDEIDHARLEKKKSSDCLCQRVRADAVVLARLSFSEASLALSCEWECWNDMKVVTFRLAWGHGPWAPELHMATALDKSTHFLAAFLFVATTKAWVSRLCWEKLNKCVKPKWKQTTTQASKRDEVAFRLTNNNDEIWAWTPCGDCAGQYSALSLLSSSSAKRPWQSSKEVEKIAPNQNGSKLRGRAKLDEESLAAFWRTKSSSLRFDSRSDISSGSVRSDGSAQGADPLEHCSNGSGSERTGRTAKSNARPALIWFCFWGQIECAPGVSMTEAYQV